MCRNLLTSLRVIEFDQKDMRLGLYGEVKANVSKLKETTMS